MVKYILKRLGLAILILFGVSLILYFLVRLMPVNFVTQKITSMDPNGIMSQEVIDTMLKQYGLEDNSFLGILQGYFNWLLPFLRGDLGISWTEETEPVVQVIARKIGPSFGIAFVAIIFEYLIAIPLGVTAATHQYSIRDYIVTVLVMIGISLPSFFFGRIAQLVFGRWLEWFPSSGQPGPGGGLMFWANWPLALRWVWHSVLPVGVMTILSIGGTMRYMRTNMLEVLNSDYIRTARAKGLPESKVIYKHAFRNTMIPIVTMLAGVLPSLFSGAMITEEVFGFPGIGQFAVKAMTTGDIPFIMSYNMIIAVLSVVGVFLSDLMYAVVDPRVKLY